MVAVAMSMVTRASRHFKIPLLSELGKNVRVRLLESRENVPLNRTQMGNRHTRAQTEASSSRIHFSSVRLALISSPPYTFFRLALNWTMVTARMAVIRITPSVHARPRPDLPPR